MTNVTIYGMDTVFEGHIEVVKRSDYDALAGFLAAALSYMKHQPGCYAAHYRAGPNTVCICGLTALLAEMNLGGKRHE